MTRFAIDFQLFGVHDGLLQRGHLSRPDKPETDDLEIHVASGRIERIGYVLTAAELAKLLRVSRVTVFRLAAAGRLPSFKVGTWLRFDPRRVQTASGLVNVDAIFIREASI